MILEVDNIIENARAIRKALFAIEPKAVGAASIIKVGEMKELVNELEFRARGLEFELNEGSKDDD